MQLFSGALKPDERKHTVLQVDSDALQTATVKAQVFCNPSGALLESVKTLIREPYVKARK